MVYKGFIFIEFENEEITRYWMEIDIEMANNDISNLEISSYRIE